MCVLLCSSWFRFKPIFWIHHWLRDSGFLQRPRMSMQVKKQRYLISLNKLKLRIKPKNQVLFRNLSLNFDWLKIKIKSLLMNCVWWFRCREWMWSVQGWFDKACCWEGTTFEVEAQGDWENAEMENVMDRTRREAENSKKFAIQVWVLAFV